MYRIPLLLSLLLLIGPAWAEESVADPGRKPACPQAEQANGDEAGKDAHPGSGRPGDAAPVRPRASSAGRSGPRWHSLLPGMMR
ncbi:hypothetical protein [Arenimonas fontis]|uniref:Uncharacterized protein n=1 Tax=Arenimonas fontis TaxID=2608255 RepID=A0A5B2ZEG2_9GAMM|nr:hypothetical protein [Arenimonas fontis]KAA2285411.1 hypothetical protein F0415_05720 [Arenimonas fontis]